MPLRSLINADGREFDSDELTELRDLLDGLSDDQRTAFRNENANQIAEHPSTRVLIVSGPGTGKSTLFKQRINYWLTQEPEARILAVSFVRKLVADLANDIQSDDVLTEEQKLRIEAYTLHRYARSVVERNNGSSALRFERHLTIINEYWKEVVWEDVMNFSETFEWKEFSWKEFERQLHEDQFDDSEMWRNVREGYFTLSKFYNAAGFADLILHARDALVENPDLACHEFCIVDEFQDFNAAENALIQQLTQHCQGLLVVGDDDQVLYETLKSGNPDLIRNLYADADFANAMLPFCGRCSFHITKASAHFIQQESAEDSIEKIYLPLSTNEECQHVHVIACATPTAAVDYIRKFVEDHRGEIESRRNNAKHKDSYLMILTPSMGLRFYRNGDADQQLLELVEEFKIETRDAPEDYYKLLSYYGCATHPEDNFTFRKLLFFENLPSTDVVALIRECLETRRMLCDLSNESVASVLEKSRSAKVILDSQDSVDEKIDKLLGAGITFQNRDGLRAELIQHGAGQEQAQEIEDQEEEEAELDELEIKKLSVVELMSIVGSKGLSADHVIIIGFDNVNMDWITRNAFFVAMTRARTSLHLLTALRSGGAERPAVHLRNLPHQHIEFYKYVKGRRQKERFTNQHSFIGYLDFLRKH